MKPIVTLTLNPCIDGACEAERIHPSHKIRTSNERYDPGGGGINVARVIVELGRPALPVYLSGGATGSVLDELLALRGFDTRPIRIRDHTRISHAVFETSTGHEYRFVPEGPLVEPADWQACLAILDSLDYDWLVASGSLPRGIAPDCYADLAGHAARRGARFVLDTSGPALGLAIAGGGVELAKPSLGEFRALTGLPLETEEEIAAAALDLVRSRDIRLIAVTMGHRGALLATSEGTRILRPPDLPVQSATGAGDSFLGAMTFALAEGRSPEDAFALGVAAGSATVLTPGTGLCLRADVERLYASLSA
ncbi:MAG: 1-phosphofructokinase family hexose kinase [Rhodobacteraceae bacterium]|nr:1-phosphofructokinase family hexose kinase [Paracoccaceae bacterium]